MSECVVECRRWLGFSKRYVVRVDGLEIGRLGRRSKEVTVDIRPGRHSFVVDYNGQSTPEEHADLAPDENVRYELVFTATYRQILGRELAKSPSERVRHPIAAPGESSLMRLVRLHPPFESN